MKSGKLNCFRNDICMVAKGLAEIWRIQWGMLVWVVIQSVLNAILPFINIYMSALIVNHILLGTVFRKLLMLVMVTISLNFGVMLLFFLLGRIVRISRFAFGSRYQMRMHQKLMSLDYVDMEKKETHDLYQKIKNYQDINDGGIWCIVENCGTFVQCVFQIVFSVSLTYSLFTVTASGGNLAVRIFSSAWGSFFLIAAILINVIVNVYSNSAVTKKIYGLIDSSMIPINRIVGYYLDYISAYQAGKDIRIYNQKKLVRNECAVLLDNAAAVADDISRHQIKYEGLAVVSSVALSVFVYLFVGVRALAGLFSAGFILQYIGSINQFILGFTACVNQFAALKENNPALKAYFDFMELPENKESGRRRIEGQKYEVEFKNVSFIYPGADAYALKDLNLKISFGERLAIVGMNGSGKTTMVKLLCRLYAPTKGIITLNGIDVKEFQYGEYISLLGVVFQDFKLFSFSLAENVAASSQYFEAAVEHCLKKAGIFEYVAAMPKGIQTPLYRDFDEDGVEISGGEAQKVALARAFYKDAPFLILDEPTAALDAVAEYEIYNKFNQIVTDKTVVYISHRLASCRFCDRIVVFDHGRLVQQGSHDTLLSDKNGKYYSLWEAQARHYI